MNALGSGQHTKPESRHIRVRRSSSTYSLEINANAAPKISAVPARFPRMISLVRQMGNATSTPISGGTVSISAIQNQLSSFSPTDALMGHAVHHRPPYD